MDQSALDTVAIPAEIFHQIDKSLPEVVLIEKIRKNLPPNLEGPSHYLEQCLNQVQSSNIPFEELMKHLKWELQALEILRNDRRPLSEDEERIFYELEFLEKLHTALAQ